MTGETISDNSGQSEPIEKYRLAVLSAPTDRDGAVALLWGYLGMTAIDAKTRLRHIPAIWPECLSREKVQEAADGLRRLGAEAAAVPAEKVPDLRAVRTLHRVRCLPDGLEIVSTAGDVEETVPWKDVAVIGVARVMGLGHRAGGQLADGVFHRKLGISSVDLKPAEHGTELWIGCNDPARAYRLEAEHMNYEYLGDRLSPATAENLGLLFADLCRWTPQALLTASAQRYRDSEGKELDQFPNSDAHRDQVLACWMAALTAR